MERITLKVIDIEKLSDKELIQLHKKIEKEEKFEACVHTYQEIKKRNICLV